MKVSGLEVVVATVIVVEEKGGNVSPVEGPHVPNVKGFEDWIVQSEVTSEETRK